MFFLLQYFTHRTDAVELVSTFQYADDDDVFERPPYSVLVRSIKPDTGGIVVNCNNHLFYKSMFFSI